MEKHDEIIDLLKRIERNQERALETQEKYVTLAQAQLERSKQAVSESMALQQLSVARQAQIRNVALPLIGVLMLLLVYVLVKSHIFFR